MRKFIITFSTLFCFAALWITLSTCADNDLWTQSSPITHAEFSVADAQNYFEHRVQKLTAATRSTSDENRKNIASPGDFTPLWNQAIASCQKYLECYDVPIESEYQFKGVYSEMVGGKAKAYLVNVHQKLVVVRNKTTGGRGVYILTLVPDADYNKKHPRGVADLFINCGDKNGFSGIAFYSVPICNSILGVYRYKDGKLLDGVFLKGNQSERERKMNKARTMLQDIRLKSRPKVSTRSFGEDCGNGDFWGGELDEVMITSEPNWETGNEEWMEETRPGGIDYTEPVVEENTDDEDLETPDDTPKEKEEDNEKNKIADQLNKNEGLKERIKDICSKDDLSNPSTKENGWIKDAKGIHPPKERFSNKVKHDWDGVDKSITEWFHTHPASGIVPSFVDLQTLSMQFCKGYIADVATFSYGIVSDFGCVILVITDKEAFEKFANEMQSKEQIEVINITYQHIVSAEKSIGVDERVSNFSDFLQKAQTGLDLFFSKNEYKWNPETNQTESQRGGYIHINK